MTAQNLIFEHMSAILCLTRTAGGDGLATGMKSAMGAPSGRNGPVLPNLPELEKMAAELPAGYPRDTVTARLTACRHMLADDAVLAAIHMRHKIQMLPDSPRKQLVAGALDTLLPEIGESDSVPLTRALDKTVQDLADSDFEKPDRLDSAIIRNTPGYLLRSFLSMHGDNAGVRS